MSDENNLAPVNLLLEEVSKVLVDRISQYGSPKSSFERISNLWSAYLDHTLSGEDVAMMMILFKVARQSCRYSHDNVVDICGYASLMECLQ